MSNRGRQRGIGMGALKYQRTGARWQPCRDHLLDCPPAGTTNCDELDICFIARKGSTDGGFGAVFTALKNGWISFAPFAFAAGTTVRLSLVSVGPTGAITVDQVWTSVEATFIASVNAMTGDNTRRDAADINGALQDTVAGTGIGAWSATAKKVIVRISNALDGGNNDTSSGTDLTEAITAATNGLADDGIITHHIIAPLHAEAMSASHRTDLATEFGQVSAAGGGVVRQQTSGTLDFTGMFRELLEISCFDDGGSEGDGYTSTSCLHCCRDGSCSICVTATEYDGTVYNETLTWSDDDCAYTGTLAGVPMKIYDAVRDGCHQFVEVNGDTLEIVAHCDGYGGRNVNCRSRSGTIEGAVIVVDDYTLETITVDITYETNNPLRLRRTGCDCYCGSGASCATCAPREFCVTVSGSALTYTGIFTADDENCEAGTDAAVWRGTVTAATGETLTGSFELGQDEYGECVMFGSLTGEDNITMGEVSVSVSLTMSVNWGEDDTGGYYTVSIAAADCGECGVLTPCCPNEWPTVVNVTITASNCPELVGKSFALVWTPAQIPVFDPRFINSFKWEGSSCEDDLLAPIVRIDLFCLDESTWVLAAQFCDLYESDSDEYFDCDLIAGTFNMLHTITGCCSSNPIEGTVTTEWTVTQ